MITKQKIEESVSSVISDDMRQIKSILEEVRLLTKEIIAQNKQIRTEENEIDNYVKLLGKLDTIEKSITKVEVSVSQNQSTLTSLSGEVASLKSLVEHLR